MTSFQLPPPPCAFKSNDPAADAARKRVTAKSRRFISLPNLKSQSQTKTTPSSTQHLTEPIGPSSSISLDSAFLHTSDSFADKYKWAVVYENQRGIMLFSIPHYSRRSLLPFDPPPFTIPNMYPSSKQASISLDDYPLPDGTWRWVSKCWMIDMRSDAGEVQHDGFEYNWVFRAHKWSAEVGSFSAGGWVRRRRWIRLMMRPARPQILHDHEPSVLTRTDWYHQSATSSFSHLVKIPQSDVPYNPLDVDGWLKEDVEGNWQKCCSLMRFLGRDGRKLELWKLWLAPYFLDRPSKQSGGMGKGKVRHIELTEDDMMTSDAVDVSAVIADTPDTLKKSQAPSKEHIIPILRLHVGCDSLDFPPLSTLYSQGKELLRTFVYPESRANFMAMLEEAGLLHVLDVEPGFLASGMDFWSYVNEIAGH